MYLIVSKLWKYIHFIHTPYIHHSYNQTII